MPSPVRIAGSSLLRSTFVLLDSKKTRFLLSTYFFAFKVNEGNAEIFSYVCTELPLAKNTPPNSVACFDPEREKLSLDPRAHTETVGWGCSVALALWGWVGMGAEELWGLMATSPAPGSVGDLASTEQIEEWYSRISEILFLTPVYAQTHAHASEHRSHTDTPTKFMHIHTHVTWMTIQNKNTWLFQEEYEFS